jgi:Putative N-acetylmannosamine-6-phosphate epimerase
MPKGALLDSLRGGLIVSCQAREGWPMYGASVMAAFAKAAQQGGAVAIRANLPENIRAIRQAVNLPILGIYKQQHEFCDVFITPTYLTAKEIIAAGASIIAMDGTSRRRPGGEKLADIVGRIKREYPDILIMADCATAEECKACEEIGFDIVSSTLRGYTADTIGMDKFDVQNIRNTARMVTVPIIAEGHVSTPAEAKAALEAGAYAVVVGTAITRPEAITERFVNEMKAL